MQSCTSVNDRISPDITCLSSFTPGVNTVSTPVIPPSTNNTSSVHLNSIAEVPSGLYEFVVGSNGEIKILCKICQYMSNKKSNFKRHFTNMHFVHNEESSKMLECCGIRFATKGEKFQHTKSVHKSGYKCSICSKVFDRPALLQRHLAKHTGKEPYKCSLCAYQTPNKANAKRHIEKKHSDVQEGYILFVTDDGDQIQMEVVSKGIKDEEQSFSSSSSPLMQSAIAAVVKTSADSTSFGSCALAASNVSLPLSRPISVSSSSSSPPGHFFIGPMTSVFDAATTVNDIKDYGQDKKRKINHSIDTIMKQHTQSHLIRSNNNTTTITSAAGVSTFCTPEETLSEGNNASVPASPENVDSSKYRLRCDDPSTINELHKRTYCSPNWLQSSSLFPKNNDYAANNAHQVGFLPQSTYTSAPHDVRNQGSSSSFVFRQCVHGCWHHVDNQVASDFTSFVKDASSSFVPTHFFPHQSPDLRSSSSSTSQQTENSSITSLKSEDDSDSEIIDVVGGEDGDDGDDSSRKLQLLSSFCEGLGSLSTAEIPSPVERSGSIGECKMQQHFGSSPPVESSLQRQGSFSSNDSFEEGKDSVEDYIPKKLRVSRGHCK